MADKVVTVIPVVGMTCQNCVLKIESAVAKLTSVVLVKVVIFVTIFLSNNCMQFVPHFPPR